MLIGAIIPRCSIQIEALTSFAGRESLGGGFPRRSLPFSCYQRGNKQDIVLSVSHILRIPRPERRGARSSVMEPWQTTTTLHVWPISKSTRSMRSPYFKRTKWEWEREREQERGCLISSPAIQGMCCPLWHSDHCTSYLPTVRFICCSVFYSPLFDGFFFLLTT